MSRSQLCDKPHLSLGLSHAQILLVVERNRSDRFSPISGASDSEHRPRRLAPSVMIWITRGHGAACDACGRTIGDGEPQYEVVANGREMCLDRDCFQRRMSELA